MGLCLADTLDNSGSQSAKDMPLGFANYNDDGTALIMGYSEYQLDNRRPAPGVISLLVLRNAIAN